MSARDKTRLYRRLIVLRSCLLLFNILYSSLSYFVLVWCFFPAAAFSMNTIVVGYLLLILHITVSTCWIQTTQICHTDSVKLSDCDSYYERVERKEESSGGKIQSVQKLQKLQFLKWPFELQLDSFRLQSHRLRERSVNPAVTTTHQGKGCNPKRDWHNCYFEGEDSQFPVCVTFPLPLSKLLASVCKQVSDCRKLLVTKGVCITLCDCGEGVVPGSAAAAGWWRIE